jgi:hypothetical protein
VPDGVTTGTKRALEKADAEALALAENTEPLPFPRPYTNLSRLSEVIRVGREPTNAA